MAKPTAYTKKFRHPGVGPITTTTTSFAVNAVPGARLVVAYTPDDEQSGKALAQPAAGDQLAARFPCWSTRHPQRSVLAPAAAS